MKRAIFPRALVCLLAAASASAASKAQDVPGGSAASTATRAADVNALLAPGSRQEVPGIRMGSFIIQPRADASVAFDDNVFATPAGRESDTITRLSAALDARSDWSRHEMEIHAGGSGSFYATHDSENKATGDLGLSGVLDVHSGFWLKAQAKYGLSQEERGFGESSLNFDEPIQTRKAEAAALAHRQFNRLWLELGGGVKRLDYRDGEIAGVVVDQSFRDGTLYSAVGRAGYEVSPKTSVFVEGIVTTRDFADARFEGDDNRALVGVRHELTRLVQSEAAVGYLRFRSAGGLSDVDSWTYRGRLSWAATPLIAVALVGARDMGSPTEVGGESNTIDTTVGARVDYAIRRDVTLTAGVGYGWLDYVDIDRTDNYLKVTAGAEYQFSQSLSVWANYGFYQYDLEAVPDLDYEKNVVMLGLRARY